VEEDDEENKEEEGKEGKEGRKEGRRERGKERGKEGESEGSKREETTNLLWIFVLLIEADPCDMEEIPMVFERLCSISSSLLH
jgi:hypothetical protein